MNLALYQLERGELMNYIVWLSLLLSFFSCQSIENKSGFSSLISTKIENNKGETQYEIEVKKGLKTVEYFYNQDGKLVK